MACDRLTQSMAAQAGNCAAARVRAACKLVASARESLSRFYVISFTAFFWNAETWRRMVLL